MNSTADFFLTAAGEFRALEAPRACRALQRLQDAKGKECLLVSISPPMVMPNEPVCDRLILSARNAGTSLAEIETWPFDVLVSRIEGAAVFASGVLEPAKVQPMTWASLYETHEAASNVAARHASSLRFANEDGRFFVASLRFHGEQDGIPERRLKAELATLFDRDHRVWKAYLAQVDFGPGTSSVVALCLRGVAAKPKDLIRQVKQVFAQIFSSREALHVIFVDRNQEESLARVCTPFFAKVVFRDT